MTQSRGWSFVESIINVAIGYAVALASQLIIFPLYGIHIDLTTNVAIGAWFTVVSIIRSYCVRRAFNTFHAKGLRGVSAAKTDPRSTDRTD